MHQALQKTVTFICGLAGSLSLHPHLALGIRIFSTDAKLSESRKW